MFWQEKSARCAPGSVLPEDMHFLEGQLDDQYVIDHQVTRHPLVIDVEAQTVRNLRGVLGQFLGEVRD